MGTTIYRKSEQKCVNDVLIDTELQKNYIAIGFKIQGN